MKFRHLLLTLAILGCNSPKDQAKSENQTADSTENTITSPVENITVASDNEVIDETDVDTEAAETVDSEESPLSDCIFDFDTQNDDFVKEVPEFSNYTWNDSTKTATIILQNADTLMATRGGCDHFGISGKWIQENKKHTIEEVDYWLEQALWISQKIMAEPDYNGLKQMIENQEYNASFDDNRLFIEFTNHDYSAWYLTVYWVNNYDNVVVETGYYFG